MQVNWTAEKDCFQTFLRELAFFYAPTSLLPGEPDIVEADQQPQDDRHRFNQLSTEQQWQVQHVLFPAMQRYLQPPTSLIELGAIKQISSMASLYKVFERC